MTNIVKVNGWSYDIGKGIYKKGSFTVRKIDKVFSAFMNHKGVNIFISKKVVNSPKDLHLWFELLESYDGILNATSRSPEDRIRA